MKFLALIPARYGSTRFEGKPLVDIFGVPMVVRVYRKATEVFEEAAIATDDERIKTKAEAYGCRVVMTSPDHKSGTDRCCEALNKIEAANGTRFDVVVNIQGDEPFIATHQLQELKKCFDDPQTRLATLVKPFGENEDIFNPNSPKVALSKEREALYFSRSAIPYMRGLEQEEWQAHHTYYKHIGLYGYRSEVLREVCKLERSPLEICESLEQLRWLENGYRIKCGITWGESYAIDTPEDLALVLKQFKDQENL